MNKVFMILMLGLTIASLQGNQDEPGICCIPATGYLLRPDGKAPRITLQRVNSGTRYFEELKKTAVGWYEGDDRQEGDPVYVATRAVRTPDDKPQEEEQEHYICVPSAGTLTVDDEQYHVSVQRSQAGTTPPAGMRGYFQEQRSVMPGAAKVYRFIDEEAAEEENNERE